MKTILANKCKIHIEFRMKIPVAQECIELEYHDWDVTHEQAVCRWGYFDQGAIQIDFGRKQEILVDSTGLLRFIR